MFCLEGFCPALNADFDWSFINFGVAKDEISLAGVEIVYLEAGNINACLGSAVNDLCIAKVDFEAGNEVETCTIAEDFRGITKACL